MRPLLYRIRDERPKWCAPVRMPPDRHALHETQPVLQRTLLSGTCGKRACPAGKKLCDGVCISNDACCAPSDCPTGEVCGSGQCGCVPDLSTCLPTGALCPGGFGCDACCDPNAQMVSCGVGQLSCGVSGAGSACGPDVDCAGSGQFASCLYGRCCIDSGAESTLVGGDCSTCWSRACLPNSIVCAWTATLRPLPRC